MSECVSAHIVMSVTSWNPQTSMSSKHPPMSASIEKVPGYCGLGHILFVRVVILDV